MCRTKFVFETKADASAGDLFAAWVTVLTYDLRIAQATFANATMFNGITFHSRPSLHWSWLNWASEASSVHHGSVSCYFYSASSTKQEPTSFEGKIFPCDAEGHCRIFETGSCNKNCCEKHILFGENGPPATIADPDCVVIRTIRFRLQIFFVYFSPDRSRKFPTTIQT